MTTLNAIRDTFFLECEDLLEALAEGLALMEEGSADGETLNAVFRAVHSIKGGAGAFALDHLVAFAHRFETVLDEIRSDRLALTSKVMHILLRSADHLADLVEAAREDRSLEEGASAGFIANLDHCLGETAAATLAQNDPAGEDASFGFAAITLDLDEALLGPDTADDPPKPTLWQIHFAPGPELFSNGHEPIHLITSLADLGKVTARADLSRTPDWDALSPSDAWIGWDITLETTAARAEIESHFEFVLGLCKLEICEISAAAPLSAETADTPTTDAMPPSPSTPPSLPLAQPAPEGAAQAYPVPAPEGAPSSMATAAPEDTPSEAKPDTRRRAPPEDEGEGRNPKATLRVDLERVDRLINAVGELIINQAMIEQSVLDLNLPTDAEVIAHTEDYRLFARDLQEAVMAIRAQPVKPLFQRMSRILREAAEATGKRARLLTFGDSTEVDKTVIERLADPLTHMIRNAVDHGLETPAARQATGKDPEGTIHLSAAHRSGSVLITLRDDGAGLDRAKILAKAIAKGLVPPEAEFTEAEIDNLLFLPGFSTAETISNLSGRGVGLDVVRNAVTALGGRVTIASAPGQGTEFTIALPLTLAVMDGMIISVAGQTMVIPIASVIETIRPGPGDLHILGTQDKLLSIRGRFLPMIDVAQSLGFPERDPAQAPLLLLVETEAQTQCALIVDAVLDQRQVVIKGLESNYGSIPGVSAATVLGDGQIALILDAEALTANRASGFPSRPLPSATQGYSHALH